jgi:ligand-binding sensor domain-containing protein
LLWLRNHQSIKVINTNNEVVFSKEDDLSISSLPFLFDGETTWYGHSQGGLIKTTLEPNHFQTFRFYEKGLNNSSRGIYASTDGQLWASMIAGVVKEDNEKVTYKNNVRVPFTSFLKDKSNHLWYFYDDKIVKENLSTHEVTSFSYNDILHSWSLFETEQGEIWAFNNYGDIYALNVETGAFQFKSRYNNNRETGLEVYAATQKDDQSIWLCTSQGLYVVNNDGKFIALYNNEQEGEYFIPTKDIHHIYQDNKCQLKVKTH